MGDLRGLIDYEIEVLRCVSGEEVAGLSWGAAMSEAVETLKGRGFVRLNGTRYEPTDEGRAILRALEAEGKA